MRKRKASCFYGGCARDLGRMRATNYTAMETIHNLKLGLFFVSDNYYVD